MTTPESFSYDAVAATYAARVDAGGGSGWYAEQFLERGAAVTAGDASPTMAAFTRARAS